MSDFIDNSVRGVSERIETILAAKQEKISVMTYSGWVEVDNTKCTISRKDLEAILALLRTPLVFYYEAGNLKSFEEVKNAAIQQYRNTDNQVFLFPRNREHGGPGISKGTCLKCAQEMTLEGVVPQESVVVYYEAGNAKSFAEAQAALKSVSHKLEAIFVPRARDAGGVGVSTGVCVRCAKSLGEIRELGNGDYVCARVGDVIPPKPRRDLGPMTYSKRLSKAPATSSSADVTVITVESDEARIIAKTAEKILRNASFAYEVFPDGYTCVWCSCQRNGRLGEEGLVSDINRMLDKSGLYFQPVEDMSDATTLRGIIGAVGKYEPLQSDGKPTISGDVIVSDGEKLVSKPLTGDMQQFHPLTKAEIEARMRESKVHDIDEITQCCRRCSLSLMLINYYKDISADGIGCEIEDDPEPALVCAKHARSYEKRTGCPVCNTLDPREYE